ncbi:hypothetical protein [Xanthobacter sp. KR7-225]|uniref:hypothetical protein n=1 Tax=Xanthobacter sp. KR7-225 TaxID=3156613 RepID=UPI0032B41E82
MPKPIAAANAAPLPATTRRAVLKAAGALSAVAALAVPVAILPKAEAATVDPVLAAIEAFCAKRDALDAALADQANQEKVCRERGEHLSTSTAPDALAIQARVDAAHEADMDAWWGLINTAPTTREGLCAFLDMLTAPDGYGGGSAPTSEEVEAICASVRSFAMGNAHA